MANDAFCEFSGRSRETLIGQHTQALFPDSVSAATLQQDDRVLGNGKAYTVQDHVQDANDRTRFVATTKTRFQDLDGRSYLLSVARDLTEQIAAQASSKKNEKRLKKLAVNVPGIIYQFRLSADLEPSFPLNTRREIEIVKAYENIPMVECYVSQLNQVFMHILTNAIDAIDSASHASQIHQISLQTFQTADFVVIRIANNGPPISSVNRKRMFDPFFTTKPIGQGTGMGLAISYQTIVDLHKGTLEYSQSEDGKTSFVLEIPKVAGGGGIERL